VNPFYILSAIRSLALLALGLLSDSASAGVIGFLEITFSDGTTLQTHTGKSFGHTQPLAPEEKKFLTSLSSSE